MRFLISCIDRHDVYQIEATPQGGALLDEPLLRVPGQAMCCQQLPDGGFLACDSYNVYRYDQQGRILRGIGNRLLADLHWVSLAPCASAPDARFLVASTAADAVFLMDWEGAVHWGWWADEHGFGEARFGHEWDYRATGQTSAQEHLLHPNHLLWKPGWDFVLITGLGPFGGYVSGESQWDQGVVLRAWFDDRPTERVLENLRAPHSFTACSNGWLLAQSTDYSISRYDGAMALARKFRDEQLWWVKVVTAFSHRGHEHWLVGKGEPGPALWCIGPKNDLLWKLPMPSAPFCIEPLRDE